LTLKHKQQLEEILRTDDWSMDVLRTVAELGLPDWAIGAGFVRSLIWDSLSGQERTPLDDVDVLYFESTDTSGMREKQIEHQLLAAKPDVPWSVKNQARMHVRNKTKPYQDIEDALKYWLETPTAVAVRLEPDQSLTILAPFGLQDLFDMMIRPTPRGEEQMDQFEERIAQKPWLQNWPRLRIVRPG
jgi:uncharacterized protein